MLSAILTICLIMFVRIVVLTGGEVKRKKWHDLEKLFNDQIETLYFRGFPNEIVKMLRDQKSVVLSKAYLMTFEDGYIPFLPVIPLTFCSPYDLIARLKINKKAGYTEFSPNTIFMDGMSSKEAQTPNKPYYLYNVENNEAAYHKSLENAKKSLKMKLHDFPDALKKLDCAPPNTIPYGFGLLGWVWTSDPNSKQLCTPYKLAEVMALCIHTDVFSRYDAIWPTRCRYSIDGVHVSTYNIPVVRRDNDGRPQLTLGWEDNSRQLGVKCIEME